MKSLLVFLALTAVAFAGTSEWTLHDLAEHLEDPNLDPQYRPYLEAALNEMMAAIMAGETMDVISITLPMTPVITPTPTVPSVPTPPTVVAPEIPSAPSASSPLVQIIVNVNNKQQEQAVPETPAQLPETPAQLPEIEPPQVIIVDQAPETVVVVENPPEGINIIEQPENPIDIIAINPPEVTNPADLFPLPIMPIPA